MRFVFVSERETLDGAILLRAEPDGVNLFFRSLDMDLEDAQAATERVGGAPRIDAPEDGRG